MLYNLVSPRRYSILYKIPKTGKWLGPKKIIIDYRPPLFIQLNKL